MNGESNLPPEKTASLRVPEVPDEYVKKRVSRWFFLSYLLIVLVPVSFIWGVGVAWQAHVPATSSTNPVHTPIAAHPTATPRPVPTPAPTPQSAISVQQLSCSNPPPAPTNKPALFFCAPIYKGNVAGPLGVRIVLIGENFTALPTQWLMPKHALTDNNPLVQCSTNDNTNCLVLSPPAQHSPLNHGTFLVSWSWQNPFPDEAGNYFISAQLGTQIVTTPASANFSLLPSPAPCIMITQGQAGTGCATGTLSFAQGAMLTIHGENWLLGWSPTGTVPLNIQIHIVATCARARTCNAPKLFDITVDNQHIARDGTFSVPYSINKSGFKGIYTVSAWNITKDDAGKPGVEGKTSADQVLIFGPMVGDLLVQVS